MVNIPSTIKISARSLRMNKMRSVLTMLGIIIGVSAVITIFALGTGANKKMEEQISSIGSNLLLVFPKSRTRETRRGAGTKLTLTTDDAEAIQKEPAVLYVAPIFSGGAQIVYGRKNWSTRVMGTTPNLLKIRDWKLSAGRPFT